MLTPALGSGVRPEPCSLKFAIRPLLHRPRCQLLFRISWLSQHSAYQFHQAGLKARRSGIFVAAGLIGSAARCAYRAVVCTCVCPSNFPIIANPSPTSSPPEANAWRSVNTNVTQSCRFTNPSPWMLKVRQMRFLFLPTMTYGLPGTRGSASNNATAASPR